MRCVWCVCGCSASSARARVYVCVCVCVCMRARGRVGLGEGACEPFLELYVRTKVGTEACYKTGASLLHPPLSGGIQTASFSKV